MPISPSSTVAWVAVTCTRSRSGATSVTVAVMVRVGSAVSAAAR